MFLKRYVPLLIVIGVGLLTLFGHFINHPGIQNFVDNDSTQWFDIIASFAIFLGSLNMLKLQVIKIFRKQKNWQYSILAVFGFAFAIFAGFFYRGAYYINVLEIEKDQLEQVSEYLAGELNAKEESIITNQLKGILPSYAIPKSFSTKSKAENFKDQINIFDLKMVLKEKGSSDYSIFISEIQKDQLQPFLKLLVEKLEVNKQEYIEHEIRINHPAYKVPKQFTSKSDAELFMKKLADFGVKMKIKSISPDTFNIHLSEIQKFNIRPLADYLADNLNLETETILTNQITNTQSKYEIPKIFLTKSSAEMFMDSLGVYNIETKLGVKPWGAHLQTEGSLFSWMFFNIFNPLSATMFALLAFFVASASYRAFRIRNFEATLLLISGIILMLGRVPVGELIPWWVVAAMIMFGVGAIAAPWIKDRKILFSLVSGGIVLFFIAGYSLGWNQSPPQVLLIPVIQDWIFDYPTTAGSRALMIGIALGIVATSFRIIVGIERSFLGE